MYSTERVDDVTEAAAEDRCVYGLFSEDFRPDRDADVFEPAPGDHCVYSLFEDDFDPATDGDVFTAHRR